MNAGAIVQYVPPVEDDPELETFKRDVRAWIELDDSIRRLQTAIRERREARAQLNSRVLQFMANHNIEDLTAQNVRLRYKTTYVRKPLTHDSIRQRIIEHYAENQDAASTLNDAVFANRERGEKYSIRRLRDRRPPAQPAG